MKLYRRGMAVKNITEFMQRTHMPSRDNENPPLFYFGSGTRPLTYGFIQGMPLRVIENAIKAGRLFVAEKIQEDK